MMTVQCWLLRKTDINCQCFEADEGNLQQEQKTQGPLPLSSFRACDS